MCLCVRACVCEPLTDNVHLADVQPHFREGGDAGSGVVPSTVTIFSSGAIGRTLGGIIQPGEHTHTHTGTHTHTYGTML